MNYLSKLRTAVLIENHKQREDRIKSIPCESNKKRMRAYYNRLDLMVPAMLQPQAD